MQRIALHIANELVHSQGIGLGAIAQAEVDLVQMARAIVQKVQGAGVLGLRVRRRQGRQLRANAVAQRIMLVAQRVGLAA